MRKAGSSRRSQRLPGWKVFDLTEKEHVHAGVLLGKLSDRRYSSVEEVNGDLQLEF
jgi:hypothetical protein